MAYLPQKLVYLAVFGLLYYVAVLIGLESRIDGLGLIWPANGIAFGFFILSPKKEWPLYVMVLSMGYIAGLYATGDFTRPVIMGLLSSNIIQTIVGSWLVQRYVSFPATLATLNEIFFTLFCTAIVGSLASACFAVMVLGVGFMKTPWELWMSGVVVNAGSTLLTLPLVLLWANKFTFSKFTFPKFTFSAIRNLNIYRWVEALVLIVVTLLLTEYIFSVKVTTDVLMRTLSYLLIPCVIWSSLRFGQKESALLVFVIVLEIVRHTLLFEGSFAQEGSGFLLVLTFHLYISVLVMTGLVVAALMRQQAVMLESLAGSIAHELRNPLGQIQYSVQNIKQVLSGLTGQQQQVILPVSELNKLLNYEQQAQAATQQGLQIIDMTLHSIKGEITATESDKITLFSAKQLTQQTVDGFVYHGEHDKQRICLQGDEDFLFKVNTTLYTLVVYNLFKNALYYFNDYPDIVVTIELQSGTHHNKIHVTDTGPGIAKKKISKLFTSFYSSGKLNGTGLGLAYCKRVMDVFGGSIQCESIEGEYTRFTLSFPVVSTAELEAYQQPAIAEMSEIKGQECLQSKTLLVIDDEKINRDQVKHILEPCGLNIIDTHCGQTALTILEQVPCDAILLDLHMPSMDGRDVSGSIRSGKPFKEFTAYKSIPIIALTGDHREETVSSCMKVGMNVCLTKPIDQKKLIQTLIKCLSPTEVDTIEYSDQLIREQEHKTKILNDHVRSMSSKLIHDLMTPMLMITVYSKAFKQHLPSLIELYAQSKVEPAGLKGSADYLSAEKLKVFSQFPDDHMAAMVVSQQQIDIFWAGVNQQKEQRVRKKLCVNILGDLKKTWQLIEEGNRSSVQVDLPKLLASYKHSIPKLHLKAIDEAVEAYVEAIQKAQNCLIYFEQQLVDKNNAA